MSEPEIAGLQDLYALMLRYYGDADPLVLAERGFRWVMDLDGYRKARAACRAAGAVYPDDADDDPRPGDRLFGLLVEVRDGGGAPRLERMR